MKRILLLSILIFSITLIFQVKSYTMAKVENTANISITTSGDALIAVPENIEVKVDKHVTENITNQLTDLGEQKIAHAILTNYKIVNSNLEIKNNMNKKIIVKVSLAENYEGISLQHNEGRLSPGGLLKKIRINIDNDIQEIPETLKVEIYAEWDDGSAVIEDQIQINVNEIEPAININTIDLRTPTQEALPDKKEDETNNNDIKIDNGVSETINEAESIDIQENTGSPVENKLLDINTDNLDKDEDL